MITMLEYRRGVWRLAEEWSGQTKQGGNDVMLRKE
jgi:hypothetical protein